MPKIPLYNAQVNMQTRKGVTINPSVAVNLANAESAADQAVTEGIFNIMEETIGAGKEYLEKREENKRKADNNAYTLWQGDLSSGVEEAKKGGYSSGLDASGVYTKNVLPYLNEAFDKWVKDNNIKVTGDMRQRWELDKKEIQRKELLVVEQIRTQAELDTGIKTAQLLYNENKTLDDADLIIDKLDITEDRKKILKQQGRIDGFSFQLNNATTTKQVDKILKEAETEKDSKKIGIKEYNQIVSNHRTIRERLYRETASPIISRLDKTIAMGEVLDESGEFKDLDKTDQERVRTKYAITDYNKRTEEEKTKSSKARVALLSRINDGKVTREDYQKDELYGQLLPLDQQYIIYDIESKERADERAKDRKSVV